MRMFSAPVHPTSNGFKHEYLPTVCAQRLRLPIATNAMFMYIASSTCSFSNTNNAYARGSIITLTNNYIL